MQQKIIENLSALERQENIRILYACESGSRAWGFPSADSDYDVRFIYVRERDWYLRLDAEHCRDVVEQPINNLLDINGWDLKKALLLLRKSNPALIEWLHSPIVYRAADGFVEDFRALIGQLFSPKACFYHYASMAQNNYREYLRSDMVRVKKYFYVLRPIFAMQWIEQGRGVVPMEFETLVEVLVTDEALKNAIMQLVAEKRMGFESDKQPRIDRISTFIDSELTRLQDKGQAVAATKTDIDKLNAFFLATLNGKYL